MIRFALLFLLVLPLAHADLPDRQLSAAQAAEEIALLRQALEDIHPGYGRYTPVSDMEVSWSRMEADAVDGVSANALYVSVSRILSELRCDHTKAEIPDWLERYRDETPTYLPLQGTLRGERFHVWHSGIDGIRRGDELTSINGRPMAELIGEILPLIAFDGYTEHARAASFGVTSELKGGALDHFLPLLHGASDNFDLVFATQDGAEKEVSVAPLTYGDWLALNPDSQGRYVNFSDDDQVRLAFPANGVAVLSVDTFVNYRTPVDPDDVYQPLMQQIRDAGADTLILDIRKNGGGSDDASLGLLRYLMDQPFQVYREKRVRSIDHGDLVDYLGTWEKRALRPNRLGFKKLDDDWYRVRSLFAGDTVKRQKPARGAFDGRLIVLTDRNNASASTALMTQLKKRDNTVFVGETTGGNPDGTTAGVLFFLTLPHSGITVRVPWLLQIADTDERFGGYGLTPDVPVDIAIDKLVDGQDPVLARALEVAGGSR